MSAKTLREVALEMGYPADIITNSPMGDILELTPRYAVMQDEKGLHLTDLLSWARFSPITIGRKSPVTVKGLQLQVAQLKQYLKQTGQVA